MCRVAVVYRALTECLQQTNKNTCGASADREHTAHLPSATSTSSYQVHRNINHVTAGIPTLNTRTTLCKSTRFRDGYAFQLTRMVTLTVQYLHHRTTAVQYNNNSSPVLLRNMQQMTSAGRIFCARRDIPVVYAPTMYQTPNRVIKPPASP